VLQSKPILYWQTVNNSRHGDECLLRSRTPPFGPSFRLGCENPTSAPHACSSTRAAPPTGV